jgi:hypothetical protein
VLSAFQIFQPYFSPSPKVVFPSAKRFSTDGALEIRHANLIAIAQVVFRDVSTIKPGFAVWTLDCDMSDWRTVEFHFDIKRHVFSPILSVSVFLLRIKQKVRTSTFSGHFSCAAAQ